ncbi:MAG: DNA polymerase III subunit gamma/tau [Oscillospiraceae bacterium]|nr:DNA polymerase III subunit gamma/tau [Oscillospiraceae bacterium]
MYQALYRKWRPQTFDEVIGQQHITETLKSQVKNGRLSHAYLFIGTRGTGKTTCARILARAVNCEHPENGNPCGKCPACRGILEGSVMDVVELDAASNNGVDNVRALREEAVFSPSTVKKRVYIVDEVHMLSMPAFNALLKILEEPPEHLMFILATTELQKVPATILSRCQRHSFRRLDADTISHYLLDIAGRENMVLEPEAADLIARLSDGGVRDALSLLDQCSMHEKIDVQAVYTSVGLAGNRRISELLDAVLKHDSAKALELFSGMWMDGKDPSSVLKELSTLLRDTMMLSVAPKAGFNLISGSFEERTLRYFVKRMTTESIIAAMETVQRCLNGLRDVNNPRTAAELCLVALSCEAEGDSFASLRARISRLEEQVERGVPALAPPRFSPSPEEERPTPEEEVYPREPEGPELVTDDFPEPEDAPLPEPEPEAEQETEEEQEKGRTEQGLEDPQSWDRIRSAALSSIPYDVRLLLEDEERVRGIVEGNSLVLEAQTDFMLKRFQRQDVLQSLMAAARDVCGHEMRVQTRLMQAQDRQARSLDDLRQFKEVHFIEE